MPTGKAKSRDLSRLNMVGTPEARTGWQSLVQTADLPGERLEGARSLPMDLIDPDPDQPRKRFDPDRLATLVQSIRDDGVIEPIVVREHPDTPDRYIIVAGERRWRAAQKAGHRSIPAIITEERNPETLARMMLHENLVREDLDIEDLGQYLVTLNESGYTQRDLAAMTQLSLGKINGLLQLVAHPDLLEQIRNGELTQEQALEYLAGERKARKTAQPAVPAPRPATPAPGVTEAAISRYRPLARLHTWAGTFKPNRVPRAERPALRAHLTDTIERLTALRDALGTERD